MITWPFLEILANVQLLTSTVNHQTLKLKFQCNKFGKKTVNNLQTRVRFRKSHVTKLKKSWTNFIYQRVSPKISGWYHVREFVNSMQEQMQFAHTQMFQIM